MRKRQQEYQVKLSKKDKRSLEHLTRKGKVNVRVYKRARVLLCAHAGIVDQEIEETVGVSNPTIKRLRKTYVEAGLKAALAEGKRSGRPSIFDGKSRAKITALACSPAPKGYSQWSLRLLADKAIELKLVETISHTEVGNILKKTTSNRSKKGSGVLAS
jgi:putative transposase